MEDRALSYRKYALLALAPAAVALFGEAVLKIFVPPGPEFPSGSFKSIADANFLSIEASSRLKILGLFLLIVVIAAGIVIKYIWDFWELRSKAGKQALFESAGICLLSALIIMLGTSSGAFSNSIDLLGAKTFETAGKLIETATKDVPGLIDMLVAIVRLSTAIVALAIIALISGSISCLLFPSTKYSGDRWQFQFGRFKQYSYAAAVLLVIGVLFFQSRAYWPGFAFAKACANADLELDACAYESHASALTLYAGVQYSLLLLSYCLPIAAIFDIKADRIARAALRPKPAAADDPAPPVEAAADSVSIQKYREDNGLSISIMDQIKAPLVFFAPLLAGGLADIVKIVTGT